MLKGLLTDIPLQMLSPDEYFNVMKLQNGVDCSKDEVKTVCLPLPCSKDGKIKIRDFLYLDIHRSVGYDVIGAF